MNSDDENQLLRSLQELAGELQVPVNDHEFSPVLAKLTHASLATPFHGVPAPLLSVSSGVGNISEVVKKITNLLKSPGRFLLSSLSKVLLKMEWLLDLLPNGVRRALSVQFVNRLCSVTTNRPNAFSTWSPSTEVMLYTSWPMLIDRHYWSRHLDPNPSYTERISKIAPTIVFEQLLKRRGNMMPSRSSALFMFFAQWFTDSVLRTDFQDRRKTTSNHNVDLCQIYGLTEETARYLRTCSGDGKLRSQMIGNQEFPASLGKVVNGVFTSDFPQNLFPWAHPGTFEYKRVFGDTFASLGLSEDEKLRRMEHLFATGLER